MNLIKMRVIIYILMCALFAITNAACAKSGYSPVVQDLQTLYETNPEFADTLDKALANVIPLPDDQCGTDPQDSSKKFCWKDKKIEDLFGFFDNWLTFVPAPETGFLYYNLIYQFCSDNQYALSFVEADPGFSWTIKFVEARGGYMDSEKSVTKKNMDSWKEALGPHWYDYKIPEGGYKTFNKFFTRELKKPRPVSGDDTLLAAPADSLINMINSNLTLETEISTKYDETLNVTELLNSSSYSEKFIGGTAASFILLPTVYHHYHAPVGGTVVESKQNVNGIFFGMGGEFDSFDNNGNIGGYKARFGIFGIYHRGYLIIKTDRYGYIGMIPVGLDDISSVTFEEDFRNVTPESPVKIAKGERVGHFAYGGSLVILLFEKGIFPGLNVLQGQQVGSLTQK